jgi:small subunit ribosomal protein S6e
MNSRDILLESPVAMTSKDLPWSKVFFATPEWEFSSKRVSNWERAILLTSIITLGTTLYRPRRTGERKRKSVRGCICGPDLAVIFLKVLEKGIGEVPGLTDSERPRRLGPKRANHIRASFALRKKDDVRKYCVNREYTKKVKKGETEIEKTFYKSPKIQRLITEKRVRRKKLYAKSKKDKWAAAKEAHVAYEKLLSKFLKEKKAAYKESH